MSIECEKPIHPSASLRDVVTPPIIPAERELVERVSWFIKLRWYAGVFLVIGTLFAHYVLKLDIPVVGLSVISSAILVYNLLFFYYFKQLSNFQKTLQPF